jgi:hypothetical protein
MMSLRNLTVVFLLTLVGVVATFGQTAEAPNKGYLLTAQQRMIPFALGMSLGVVAEVADEQHESIVKMIGGQIRYYGDELKPVMNLRRGLRESERREIVISSTDSLRLKMNRSDKWKLVTGQYFGKIFAQLKRNKDGAELNVEELRFNIQMVGVMASNAPADVPASVQRKLQEFGELSDMDDPSSALSIRRIATSVSDIIDTISQ